MKPHRTKIESGQLIETILGIISTGNIEVKRIASDLSLSVTYVHNLIRRFGYRQMLVSAEERKAIIASRQAKKPLIKSA
jgi:hypothetical protein